MDGNYLLVDETGNATEIDGEVKIGRGKASDLILEDTLVSRHHATVWMDGAVLKVRDEDSVNGTFVNHKQIYDPIELNDQDILQVGDVILTVRAPLSESATIKKTKDVVEDKVKDKAKEVVKDKAKEAVEEKLAEEEVPKKAEDLPQETLPEKGTAAPRASAAQTGSEPAKASPEITGEEILAAGDGEDGDTGSVDTKKLLIIGGILLVLACCCIVVLALGWFFISNSTTYDLIESGHLFVQMMQSGFAYSHYLLAV